MSPKQFHEKLLDKIQGGEIKMKSKSYFALRNIAYVISLAVVFGMVFYLTSLIHFVMQSKGLLMLSAFGFRGLGLMFISLPWILVILIVILITLIEVISKHFKFVYRKPLVYSIVLVAVVVLLGSMIVARTRLHYSLSDFVQQKNIPLAGPLYKHYGQMRFKHANFCTAVEINEDNLVVELADGNQVTVSITPRTRIWTDQEIAIGDYLMVAGDIDDGMITAFGIKKIPKEKDWLFSKGRQLPLPDEMK